VRNVRRLTERWFGAGGRRAAAIVRIAIATSVLMTVMRLRGPVSTGDVPGEHTLYRPIGVWMLLGRTPPPDWLVTVLWGAACGATVAMLAGAYTRVSTAVSFVAAVALASLSYASGRAWSHQYNVVFLAQLAFLGARGGDALSLDALVRRVRGLPQHDVAHGYQWSLRLVQLAVALMFAGAAFHKLLHGHFTLRWALSDNLRNQLLVTFDLSGLPRPRLVDWLIDDVWRYRTAAMLNLISQTAPLGACFLMKRPVLRAMCGLFFVVETVALSQVVALWNPYWLPLAAVFVDWDALIAYVVRRPPPTPPETLTHWTPPRAARVFVVAFIAYDALTAFVPSLDQWLNTYPFSAFPMFATVRARAPYDEHLPYAVEGDHFEVLADQPIPLYVQEWFDHQNRGTWRVRDPNDLRRRLEAITKQAQRRYPELAIHGLRLYLTIFEAPAYPAPARFDLHPVAIVGELERGVFRTALGRFDGDCAIAVPVGVELAGSRWVYYRDDDPASLAAPGGCVGAGNPIIAVAIAADGLPWLVATRAVWHWE
jgi:hypothetical protein